MASFCSHYFIDRDLEEFVNNWRPNPFRTITRRLFCYYEEVLNCPALRSPKAPISLVGDCFATAGDRHRERVAKQSRNSRQWFVISSHVSPSGAKSSRKFEHVQKFYATKFLAKWSQSHRGCLETVANLSPTPRNLVAVILEQDIFAR